MIALLTLLICYEADRIVNWSDRMEYSPTSPIERESVNIQRPVRRTREAPSRMLASPRHIKFVDD